VRSILYETETVRQKVPLHAQNFKECKSKIIRDLSDQASTSNVETTQAKLAPVASPVPAVLLEHYDVSSGRNTALIKLSLINFFVIYIVVEKLRLKAKRGYNRCGFIHSECIPRLYIHSNRKISLKLPEF
jgi:hypothetical protein